MSENYLPYKGLREKLYEESIAWFKRTVRHQAYINTMPYSVFTAVRKMHEDKNIPRTMGIKDFMAQALIGVIGIDYQIQILQNITKKVQLEEILVFSSLATCQALGIFYEARRGTFSPSNPNSVNSQQKQ